MSKSLLTSFCLAIAFLFVACKNQSQEQAQIADKRLDFTIVPGEHFGLITPATCTMEAVLAAYGDSAKADSIYIIDGMVDEGVVIFPNTPRNMVHVYWDRENDPARPAFIRITGDTTGTSDWKTADGLTLGTSIGEVERLNGKPFKLSGFGWDYGGRVTDWQGGKLSGSGLYFVFQPTGATDEKLLGEVVIDSNDPLVAAADVKVATLELRFLAKEKLPACLEEKVKAALPVTNALFVRKMQVNGQDHYWFSDGATAVDALEYVYDAECKVLCIFGGRRQPEECEKAYDNGKWLTVWENY